MGRDKKSAVKTFSSKRVGCREKPRRSSLSKKKDKAFTAYDGLQPVLAGMNRSFLTDEQQLATFFSAANGRLTATLVDGPRDRTRNLLSKDAGSNPTV